MTTVLSELRIGRLTGSRVPKALGISPYGSRADLMREMVRQHFGAEQEFTGNIATDWGNEHEIDGIDAYERREIALVHSSQDIQLHPTVDFLAATPDGLIGEDGVLEVKCPYMGSYTTVAERPDYEAQCRLLMEVTGRDWCDLAIWRTNGLNVDRVTRNESWLPSVMPVFVEFMAEYHAILADPELVAPHLEPLVDQRTDEEWQLAALKFREAKSTADRASFAAEVARLELIALSGGKAARGAGVYVIRTERKGTTSFSKAVKDLAPDADLSKYTSPPTVVFSVRTTAEGAS